MLSVLLIILYKAVVDLVILNVKTEVKMMMYFYLCSNIVLYLFCLLLNAMNILQQ